MCGVIRRGDRNKIGLSLQKMTKAPIADSGKSEASIDFLPEPSQRANSDDDFLPEPSQRARSDDDFEALDEASNSSSAREKNLDTNPSPLAGRVFASWKDVTNAVQREALAANKQVSCTSSLSGRWKKVYRCVHWLGCRKRHCQQILDLACDKYHTDENMRAEFTRLNPFDGKGACNYAVVALWNKSKGFHITSAEVSNFQHNRSTNVFTFASFYEVSIIHVHVIVLCLCFLYHTTSL